MTYRVAANPRRQLPVLDDLAIETPCKASWEAMVGDEAVRRCLFCSHQVYDLEAMGADEADAFLDEQRDASLFRRPDGRVLTAECGAGRCGRHANRTGTTLAVLTAATALAFLLVEAHTPTLSEESPVASEIAEPVVIRTVPDEAVAEDDDDAPAPVPTTVNVQLVVGDGKLLRF